MGRMFHIGFASLVAALLIVVVAAALASVASAARISPTTGSVAVGAVTVSDGGTAAKGKGSKGKTTKYNSDVCFKLELIYDSAVDEASNTTDYATFDELITTGQKAYAQAKQGGCKWAQ
jgi:hypothetical protein